MSTTFVSLKVQFPDLLLQDAAHKPVSSVLQCCSSYSRTCIIIQAFWVPRAIPNVLDRVRRKRAETSTYVSSASGREKKQVGCWHRLESVIGDVKEYEQVYMNVIAYAVFDSR
jgi:hypothetical protein